MNELIPVTQNKNGELLVSARDLHKVLKVEKAFSTWIQVQLENVDAIENEDFFPLKEKSTGGRPSIDYALKIDIAKEISMVVGVSPRTNKETRKISKQVRKYFLECERQLKENKLQLTRKEELQLKLFSNDSMEVVNAHKELVQIEIQEATKPLYREINHKEDVIVGLVEDIDLATKRQRIKQIINHNANGRFSERYGLLYKEFQDKYHIDIKRRMNNLGLKSIITNKEGKDVKVTNKIKTNQMEYIDKILCMTPQLYEIACKVFENDVEELMKEWKNII